MSTSSSMRRTVSTMRTARRARTVHENGQGTRSQVRLERRHAGDFAVELNRPRDVSQRFDANGAAASKPKTSREPGAVPAAHKLPEREHALERSIGLKHHDVEPAVIGRDIRAHAEKRRHEPT